MKKLFLTLMFICFACTTTEFITYRDSSNNLWHINVLHNSVIVDNFKVVINDSTVIDKNVELFTGNLEAKANYKNSEVKLLVTYTPGFLGTKSYQAMVFVNNELIGKFKF